MPFTFSDLLTPHLASAFADRAPVTVMVGGTPVEWVPTDTGAIGRAGDLTVELTVERDRSRTARWVTTLRNDGSVLIGEIQVDLVDLEFALPDTLPRVRHLSGSWHYDALYPPRAFRLHEEAFVTHDHARRVAIGGINSGVHSPILQVGIGLPLKEALFVGLEWSGGWRLEAGWTMPSFTGEDRPTFSITGRAELGPITLDPAESITLPVVHMGAVETDEWAQVDALQRDYLRSLMPTAGNLPALPVSYDTWFGRYHHFDIDTLMADATRAAELGVEVFCLDACWYRSENVSNGLGNWLTPDPTRFPRGEQDILALSEHVRSLGMRFGLWHLIQLAESGSDVATARPDLFRPPANTVSRDRHEREFGRLSGIDNPSFDGLVLALEHPEAVDYALDILEGWITDWGVDWFRFESVPEDGLAYNDGYNRMLDELRRRHPTLYIEACNGGGQRLDINSVRRTHGNWLSDHTSAPEVTRYQQTGAARFWPTRMLNMAVTAFEGHGDREATVYEVMSRMAGVVSFNGAIAEWSPAATASIREAVDVYKSIRHLVDQDVHFPLRQSATVEDWDAIVFASADGTEAVLLAYRYGGDAQCALPTPWPADAELLLASGDGAEATVRDEVLDVRLPPRSAALWRLRPRSA